MKTITGNITKSFLIIFSLITFTSCSEDEIQNGEEVHFESIAQPYLSTEEGLREQQLVIRDHKSWEDLLSKLEPVNEQLQYFNRTEFDFSEEILLVVIDKFRPNGGHSIQITKLLETGTQISAFVEKPQKGNATTMVMQAYHIISIKKTCTTIDFVLRY